MRYREADDSDVDAIAALHAASWLATYRGILSDAYLDQDLFADRRRVWAERLRAPAKNQWIILAEAAETDRTALVGFACAYGAHDAEHGTLLENLHVARSAQGTGLGRALVDAVGMRSARAHPQAGLHLWALASNTRARRFYERLGGAPTATARYSPPLGPPVEEVRYSWPHPSMIR